jgi:hypothetical protein
MLLMAGLVTAGFLGFVLVSLAPDLERFLPEVLRRRHFGLALGVFAALYAAGRAFVARRRRAGQEGGPPRWIMDRIDDLGAIAMGGGLTAGTVAACLGLLAMWLPHYLTWPWCRDEDTFATIAQSWNAGILPYRDIRAYNFPGTIYVFWVLGKVAGWGRTWLFFAVDAAGLILLGVILAAWGRRCLGLGLPGVLAYLVYLVFYLSQDYERTAERDWHASLAVVLGLLGLQAWPGPTSRLVSALLTAAALAIRPHVVLFLPALAAAVAEGVRIGQAGTETRQGAAASEPLTSAGPSLLRALMEWVLWFGLFTLLAFAPLLIAGIADDLVRELRSIVSDGRYYRDEKATKVELFADELREPATLIVMSLLALTGLLSRGESRRRVATWTLALMAALVYRLFHPVQHNYLVLPMVLVRSVVLALPLGWIANRLWIAPPLRLVTLLLVTSEMIPRFPYYCDASDSLVALRSLGRGQTLPEAPPPGSLNWFLPNRQPWYTWDDYRNVLIYLRETTGPTTMVANVLKSPPYPALNGPTARLSPFRAESGICWMLFVHIDLDAEFADQLEQASDSVVVWSPHESPFTERLSLPRLTQVIRKHYRFDARFGQIEVWRRATGPLPSTHR